MYIKTTTQDGQQIKSIHKQKQRLSLETATLAVKLGWVSDKLDLFTHFIQSRGMAGEKGTEICKCIGKDVQKKASAATGGSPPIIHFHERERIL